MKMDSGIQIKLHRIFRKWKEHIPMSGNALFFGRISGGKL